MSEVEIQYSSRENWYALRIRSRFDQLSETALKNKRFEVFNPTYHEWSRRKDRKKLLKKSIFKEYMFLRTTLTAEIHLEILKSYGVMQFLQNRSGPVLVPASQIANIRLLEQHVGRCFHAPEFAQGDWVRIRDGVMEGLVGQIDWMKKNLLRITVNGIAGSVAIEVNPHQVELLEKDPVYKAVVSH